MFNEAITYGAKRHKLEAELNPTPSPLRLKEGWVRGSVRANNLRSLRSVNCALTEERCGVDV